MAVFIYDQPRERDETWSDSRILPVSALIFSELEGVLYADYVRFHSCHPYLPTL